MNTKICTRCGKEKSLSSFYNKKGSKDGKTYECKECYKEQAKLNYARHMEEDNNYNKNKPSKASEYLYHKYHENPLYFRRGHLKRKYGITEQEYNVILEQQGGVCAICGKEESTWNSNTSRTRFLSVDHDHKTGKVRGIICNSCNRGLGNFLDSEELLSKAIKYLNRP